MTGFTVMQTNTDEAIIRVSITRHYGNISVELGADVLCQIGSDAARQRAYDEIFDTLINDHRRQAERMRPVATMSGKPSADGELGMNAASAPRQDADEHSKVINITGISVEINKGARRYKVHGGAYNKFGVRIFPSDEAVVSAVPVIDWQNLSVEKVNPVTSGIRALLSMASGKPVKVLQLLPPDETF